MTKKRKSRGRGKSGKGRSEQVQCSHCGAMVPRDKAKKDTRRLNFMDAALAKELRAGGTYIPNERSTRYYCISCAVHFGVAKVRAKDERKQR
ncbi:MAG: 30S ribosomal protein S26e [Nitrososphaeria archaeon]